MAVKLNSAGGGSVTLDVPSTASTFTQIHPAVNGTLVTTGDTATVTPTMLSQKLTQGTAQNTISGTAIDITGIPSWAKRITIMFNGVSLSGTALPVLQLGTASGVETTGYVGSIGNRGGEVFPTTYMQVWYNAAPSAAFAYYGLVTLCLVSGNTWAESGILAAGASAPAWSGFAKSLSATLDRIRLTSTNGTDTFDAGSVNILYEG